MAKRINQLCPHVLLCLVQHSDIKLIGASPCKRTDDSHAAHHFFLASRVKVLIQKRQHRSVIAFYQPLLHLVGKL